MRTRIASIRLHDASTLFQPIEVLQHSVGYTKLFDFMLHEAYTHVCHTHFVPPEDVKTVQDITFTTLNNF
jgi:hypothetical protein